MQRSGQTGQRIQALETLHERAVERAGGLARILGTIRAEHQRAIDRLAQLEDYARQYREQLSRAETQGGAWSIVRDMRAFIARLDAAQAAQRAEIERIVARCDAASAEWTEERRREKAFELLITQQHGILRAQAVRREFDELQEWSLNPQRQVDL